MDLKDLEIAIVNKLIEMGRSEKVAQKLAVDLVASDAIRKPLLHWLETGEEMDCVYEDISALALMRERNYLYHGALSVIAWLHRDPEKTRRILNTPVNYIEFN